MEYETSAGGVIISINHDPKILLLKDKRGKWTFPKGLIEPGENREQTAMREISEEVGIKNLKLLKTLTPVEYFYRWEGVLRKKTVYYYLFNGNDQENPVPQEDEGILEVRWHSFKDAKKIIGYKKTNNKILDEAKEKLDALRIL